MGKKSDKSTEGEQLVKQQVISQSDLDEAHRFEKESGTPWYRQLLQRQKISFGVMDDVLLYEFHSKASRKTHQSLGEALVRRKALAKEDLKNALAQQKRNGKLLGVVLIENGFVSRQEIGKALSEQYGIEYVDLEKARSSDDALDAVPESVAKQKLFVPLELNGDRLTVLISGPQSTNRLKHVGIILGYRIKAVMTAVEDIEAEIAARYRGDTSHGKNAQAKPKTSTAQKAKPLKTSQAKPAARLSTPRELPATKPAATPEERPLPKAPENSRFDEIAREAQGVPVVKLVTTIIEGAVNSGATDIHLDPQEPEMRVRYRIDGVLHDVMSIPQDIEPAIISRLKIMSDIDITETRHPQDGHISLEIGGQEFDVRVASLPTYLGERIVLRLLDQSSVLSGVRDLGLEAEDEKKLLHIIEEPYGMILVTGPTGSGKTTTLYSCLNQKNVMTDSIVTLEDPVEYQLSGINQVQIDPDIDLTFQNVLRAALRQDIDVLLVGEIRDPETARIAIRASMTGHLVFSTLHTNDAPEAISTLRNMAIPSYLIASALTAVVGQRLVRKICDNCKTHFSPTKTLLKSMKLPESTRRLHRGKGCELCYHTGTRGRTGIFEILEVNPQIRKLIGEEASVNKIAAAAKLKTMAQRCRNKVKAGLITPEEFLRVIRT